MKRRTVWVGLVAVLQIAAQVAPAKFDAASIRPDVSDRNGGTLERSGGRLRFENVSLRECVAFAYAVPTGRDYALSGPGWMDSAKFDIAATFPAETSRERVREMLQSLLSERFELKTHRERRRLPVYALVKGKGRPKLQVNTSGVEGALIFGDDHVTGRALSIGDLADRLSSPGFKLDRPVVDSTGIAGVYDFTLRWGADGPSIFTALEEQLGLKLEARTAMLQILVVDHADREPSPN